jgi:hypothetical protein
MSPILQTLANGSAYGYRTLAGAAAAPAFESIATITPSAANTITFSSIPSTYKHIQIRFLVNQTDNATMRLRFNGDSSSSSYTQHQLDANGSSVNAGGSGSGVVDGIAVATANDTTSIFTVGIIDVIDYASTTINKTARIFAGRDRNGSGAVNLRSGLYLSTSAVSSLTLFVSGANYTSGSVFSLYGIKGA